LAQLAKDSPVVATSFAMSPNPLSDEEEYFLRIDMMAEKIKPIDRPNLKFHISKFQTRPVPFLLPAIFWRTGPVGRVCF
jgi:hypothetical protein